MFKSLTKNVDVSMTLCLVYLSCPGVHMCSSCALSCVVVFLLVKIDENHEF